MEERRILIVAKINDVGGADIRANLDTSTGAEPNPEFDMHLLLSAVSIYIKGMSKLGMCKDYELLKDAIAHLEREFISATDCENATLALPKPPVKNKRKPKKK